MARCDVTEGWPRYDGKVGSAVAGRLRVAASQAAAMRRQRSRDDDVVPMVRGLDGAHPFRRCLAAAVAAAAAAGGGGDARPDLTILSSFSPVFVVSSVIKSGVSVGGARVGRGARRGESRW